VAWAKREPYFRHAVESHNVEHLVLEDVRGDAAHPEYAAVVQD
jgi:hypothetical protein